MPPLLKSNNTHRLNAVYQDLKDEERVLNVQNTVDLKIETAAKVAKISNVFVPRAKVNTILMQGQDTPIIWLKNTINPIQKITPIKTIIVRVFDCRVDLISSLSDPLNSVSPSNSNKSNVSTPGYRTLSPHRAINITNPKI